jgi:hypothetical protein
MIYVSVFLIILDTLTMLQISGAAWQLVELSRWVMEFIEKLLKECVLFHGSSSAPPPLPDESDDLFGSAPRKPFFF